MLEVVKSIPQKPCNSSIALCSNNTPQPHVLCGRGSFPVGLEVNFASQLEHTRGVAIGHGRDRAKGGSGEVEFASGGVGRWQRGVWVAHIGVVKQVEGFRTQL